MARIPITGNDEADKLLEEDPLALLIGMLLDQQVPMEWAFTGPYTLQQRLGGVLDAAQIGAMDPDEFLALCKGPPAIHRFPGSMGKRVQALAQAIVADYGGDAEAVWRDVETGDELHRRLLALPGYGEEKNAHLHRHSRQALRREAGRMGRKRRGRSPMTRPDPSRTSTRRSHSHAYASGSRRGRLPARRKPTDFRRVNSRAPSAPARGGCGRPASHDSHPRGEDVRGIRSRGGDLHGDRARHVVVVHDSQSVARGRRGRRHGAHDDRPLSSPTPADRLTEHAITGTGAAMPRSRQGGRPSSPRCPGGRRDRTADRGPSPRTPHHDRP